MSDEVPTGDELPLLDPGRIADLRALDSDESPDISSEIVALFLQETPSRMGALRAAFAADDWNEAAEAAHSIKGSAGHFGERVWTIAEELVMDCRKREAKDTQVERLASQLDALYAALRAEFGL